MITLPLAVVTALQLTRQLADAFVMRVFFFALFLVAKAIHIYTEVLEIQQDIDEEGKADPVAYDVSELKESALFNRSAAYQKVGNFSAALEDAKMIIALFPESEMGYKRCADAAIAQRHSWLLANGKATDSGAIDAAGQIVSSNASPQKDEVRHIAKCDDSRVAVPPLR